MNYLEYLEERVAISERMTSELMKIVVQDEDRRERRNNVYELRDTWNDLLNKLMNKYRKE